MLNGLRLCRRIGAFVIPSHLDVRPTDGVRGLFTESTVRAGDVVSRVPLSSCVRIDAPGTSVACRCLPSFALWKRQIQLLSREDTSILSLESSISSDDSRTGVVRVAVSVDEAALATSLGCFHFWQHVACVQRWVLPGDVLYLSTFPMHQIHNHGSEAPYHLPSDQEDGCDHGLLHACMEQIAQSIADALREYVATSDQLRVIDAFDNELLWVILSALYTVRARVLSLPVLVGNVRGRAQAQGRQSLVVPIVQHMNHACVPSCIASVSPTERCVVVRALRRIAPGDELTLQYENVALGCHPRHRERFRQRPYRQRNIRQLDDVRGDGTRAWESRYLLSSKSVV